MVAVLWIRVRRLEIAIQSIRALGETTDAD